MQNVNISKVSRTDSRMMRIVDALLAAEGLKRDRHLDTVCIAFDDSGTPVATGSMYRSALRCLAVSSAFQGEGLLNSVVSFLVEDAYARGITRLFLCTKYQTAAFFKDIGFYEIVSVKDKIAFLENNRTGFADYLDALSGTGHAAVVINANPFTRGHLALIEQASRENDGVHLFVVSEDDSIFPFSVRKRLVTEGCAHLQNVTVHDSGPYIISANTFPSYFQKDDLAVAESHAFLDAAVFVKIAGALGISRRYVGEEHTSETTRIYQDVLGHVLPESGISLQVVPRYKASGIPVSASRVRQLIHDDTPPASGMLSPACLSALRPLLPDATFSYLQSAEVLSVIKAIRESEDVIHH